jgi:hypothetical protein
MRYTLTLLLAITLIVSCKKDDEEPAPNADASGTVQLWTPSLVIIHAGDTSALVTPSWSFSSSTTDQAVSGGHHMLQEAVISSSTGPKQWRIGFVGTFLTANGQPATPQQCGTMATVTDHFYGRFAWDEVGQLFNVADGVRVVMVDTAGTVWSTDTPSSTSSWNFQVTASTSTGAITGTERQVRLTFNCVLRNPQGQSTSVRGTYQGPLVVL